MDKSAAAHVTAGKATIAVKARKIAAVLIVLRIGSSPSSPTRNDAIDGRICRFAPDSRVRSLTISTRLLTSAGCAKHPYYGAVRAYTCLVVLMVLSDGALSFQTSRALSPPLNGAPASPSVQQRSLAPSRFAVCLETT